MVARGGCIHAAATMLCLAANTTIILPVAFISQYHLQLQFIQVNGTTPQTAFARQWCGFFRVKTGAEEASYRLPATWQMIVLPVPLFSCYNLITSNTEEICDGVGSLQL